MKDWGQLENITLAVGLACNTFFYLVIFAADCSGGAGDRAGD